MSDNSTQQIEYRPIPGFPGYRVGNDGSFWSCRVKFKSELSTEWKRCSGSKNKKGYVAAILRRDGFSYRRSLHHLILISFGFNRPTPEHETRHLNGVRDDNRLSNIVWGTHTENMADKKIHGTTHIMSGVDHPLSKLTDDDIHKIRFCFCELTNEKVAEKFGVCKSSIRQIRAYITWKHLP